MKIWSIITVLKACYGSTALKKNLLIRYKGIEYTAWKVEDIETFDDLQKVYTDNEIIYIYESGI